MDPDATVQLIIDAFMNDDKSEGFYLLHELLLSWKKGGFAPSSLFIEKLLLASYVEEMEDGA